MSTTKAKKQTTSLSRSTFLAVRRIMKDQGLDAKTAIGVYAEGNGITYTAAAKRFYTGKRKYQDNARKAREAATVPKPVEIAPEAELDLAPEPTEIPPALDIQVQQIVQQVMDVARELAEKNAWLEKQYDWGLNENTRLMMENTRLMTENREMKEQLAQISEIIEP